MARTKARRAAESKLWTQLESLSSAALSRLLAMDHSAVNALAIAGCPRNKDATFNWFDVVAWLKREGRSVFRPAPPPAAVDDRAKLERFKAMNAEADYKQRIGTLISREDAERAQIRLALEFKASLMALADQLPMQLANLPAREVEARLRERITWMLSRSQDGHVPIPQQLVDAIARLVDAERPPAERMA